MNVGRDETSMCTTTNFGATTNVGETNNARGGANYVGMDYARDGTNYFGGNG